MGRLTSEEQQLFDDRIAATTIVNQAVLKCSLLGLPPTEDNIVLCVANHFDPADQRFESLIHEINIAIDELIGALSDRPRLN